MQQIKPLRLSLTYSFRLLLYLIALHSFAITVIYLIDLSFWLQVSGSIVLLISLQWYIRAYVLQRFSWSLKELRLTNKGEWFAIRMSEEQQPLKLEQTFVSHWLVVLNFSQRGFFDLPVMLFSDSVDKQVLRQLRVHLRLGVID